MIRIETKRLIIRTPKSSDAKRLLHFYKKNKKHLKAYEPDRPKNFYTETYWRKTLDSHEREYQAKSGVRFFLFEKDQPDVIVGIISLNTIQRGFFQSGNLGYSLDEKSQGKGYMHEALKEVIRFAFDDLRLHRIAAGYMPRNRKSGKVLKRLGFLKEGVAKSFLQIAGRWEDHVLTSLINRRWKELPPG